MDGEIMGAGKAMVLKSRTKWLWVGLVIGFFVPPVTGLIFGIALFFEKPYRKEALIIITWTILWTATLFLWSHMPNIKFL